MGSVVAASELYSTGSIVVAQGLSCSMTRGIIPDKGLKLCLLSTEPPEKLQDQGVSD